MSELTARPATRSRENTRLRLMDAAVEVFGEVGLDAASVEAVCERAGFTRGAFYSNFASKDELFLEIISRETETKLEDVAARVEALDVASLDDPFALVDGVMGATFDDALPPALMNEMRTQALRDEPTALAYLAWQDGMIARVDRIISGFVGTHGVRLRLASSDLARLLVEVADDTVTRAAIQRLSEAEGARALTARLALVVGALIDGPR